MFEKIHMRNDFFILIFVTSYHSNHMIMKFENINGLNNKRLVDDTYLVFEWL